MKKIISLTLVCLLLLNGCSLTEGNGQHTMSKDERSTDTNGYDTTSREYVDSLNFQSLDDPNMLRYVEDTVYSDLVNRLDSNQYFVENVQAIYISKEFLDELSYNSKQNIFFGYTLAEVESMFNGEEYIFTLGDEGDTVVVSIDESDDTYGQILKNVAIGAGVILLCITVSRVSESLGIDSVSMIFENGSQEAIDAALKSCDISDFFIDVLNDFINGKSKEDFEKKALEMSEDFKWSALAGSFHGVTKRDLDVSSLKNISDRKPNKFKGTPLNGLTIDEAAIIQEESKYPVGIIKNFISMDQYESCYELGLKPCMIDGKTALIREIDLEFFDPDSNMTNLERMNLGLPPFDPGGNKYELFYFGREDDYTLCCLTEEEHSYDENLGYWHLIDEKTEIGIHNIYDIKTIFWMRLAQILQSGYVFNED